MKREDAANQDDEVQKAQKALSDSDISNILDIERWWLTWKRRSTTLAQNGPGLYEGKAEMKKVHDAEKELDKVTDAWKPFEKDEEKKPLRIRKSLHFFI